MVRSKVLVDGRRFAVERCESAAREGFMGVDLLAPSGDKLRVIPQPDESAIVVLFPKDGSRPIRMPDDCARSRMPPSGLKVNGVRAMSGWASFACEANGRRVEGDVEFERCH